MTDTATHDLVVIGGGLAALCLTRLLALEQPEVRVLTLDRAEGPARKVGESTVEIGAHFLHARLRLAEHLRATQLPKNGLRFWFDDAANGQSFSTASEDGPITFSYWQSYQLDRERLESDLIAMNRAAASAPEHIYGVSAIDAHRADGAAPHRVRFEHEGRARDVTARWLIDATGHAAALGRAEGRLAEDERVPHGACWARFRGARSPHGLLRERGDRRQCQGNRLLSTNHLMNEGYWIWFIPLASGLMSVGVVYDRTVLRDAPRTQAEMEAFLARHHMARELLDEAEPVDFGRLDRFASKPTRYLGPGRTAAIGMAAGFVDPFYSSGNDFIAYECDYLVDLIARDRAGESEGELEERAAAYDRALVALYEQTVCYVRGLYRSFASFEVSVARYRRDLQVYWGLWVWIYFARQHTDTGFLERFLPFAERVRARSEAFSGLYAHAADRLASSGDLRRLNAGEYAFNQLGYRTFPVLRFERQMGAPLDLELAARLQEEGDAATLLAVMDALFEGDRAPLRRPLFEAVHGELTDRIFARAADAGWSDEVWSEAFVGIAEKLRERFAAQGVDLGADFAVTSETFGRLRRELLDRAADADQRRTINADWLAQPELIDLDDMTEMRDTVQPLGDWTFAHTPWKEEIGELDWSTVYDMLGERWKKLPRRGR